MVIEGVWTGSKALCVGSGAGPEHRECMQRVLLHCGRGPLALQCAMSGLSAVQNPFAAPAPLHAACDPAARPSLDDKTQLLLLPVLHRAHLLECQGHAARGLAHQLQGLCCSDAYAVCGGVQSQAAPIALYPLNHHLARLSGQHLCCHCISFALGSEEWGFRLAAGAMAAAATATAPDCSLPH